MAKVSYANLKLKVNTDIKKIEGTEIEVLQYLPIEEKYSFINIVLQQSKVDGIYNPMLLDMFFHLYLVYLYTNLSFTDKQKEDEFKIYDSLKSNGLLDKILEVIPDDEYNELYSFMEEEIEVKQRYDLSISGLISKVINELPANAEAAMKIVENLDAEKFSNVLEFAKSVNNGQLPTKIGQD